MANQLNFPDPLPTSVPARPQRIAVEDLSLSVPKNKQVIFGADARENIEIWLYNPDGSFAGHLRLGVNDPALGHITVVDNSGTNEIVGLEMTAICTKIGLEPGRYTMVANFFRDEVGSETGHKLYISDISDDRTELRLKPVFVNDEILRDLYEFTAPSVPKLFAQGLLDQLLRASSDFTNTDSLAYDVVATELNKLRERTVSRLEYSGTYDIYKSTLDNILRRTRTVVLELMDSDRSNRYIQQNDLDSYIYTALQTVITEASARGEIDPRFTFV